MIRLLVLGVVLLAQLAHAGIPELIRLLDTSAGRAFIQSERGAQYTNRILGRTLRADEDLGVLIAKLNEPEMQRVASQLEAGLKRAESRFGENFSSQTALKPQEERALRVIFDEEIRIPPGLFPSFHATSYESTRNAFLRMLEVQGFNSEKLLRFPLGIDPFQHPKWHLRFGFESEFTLKDSGLLLKAYAPEADFGISPGQWRNMRPEERVQWVKDHMKELFPSTRAPGKLVKIAKEPELSALPERLIVDANGNLEIVLPPVDTFEEWKETVSALNRHFGPGSMQGAVGVNWDAFFGKIPGQNPEVAIRENLGFFNIMNDFDTLTKLEAGALRYQTNPSIEVAKSFNHPFLGPMTRAKQIRLENLIEAHARGERIDPDTLREITQSDASFKYIGGTAYRPDLDPSANVVLEVRDAHNNMPALLDRMMRNMFFLQFGRQQFAGAAHLEAFDAVQCFARFPTQTQNMLMKLFPRKTAVNESYDNAEKSALSVFRNFSYPLRDWSGHLSFLQAAQLKPVVERAQQAYLGKLARIAQDLESGKIQASEASRRTQGALAQFSIESRLTETYSRWQSRNLLANTTWNKYVNVTLQELAPFSHAYPRSVWEGSLEIRASRLMNRWPKNVKIVNDVDFPYRGDGSARTEWKPRRVLVLSYGGLNETQKAMLIQDYLNAMSRGTVSFPIKEGANHLYVRLGHRVLDFVDGSEGGSLFNLADYILPSKSSPRRLEAIFALQPDEELKLRFYVENAFRDLEKTLGGFKMRGSASGETEGGIIGNRPTNPKEGHNCTSWICTAPIGPNRQPLLEMAGATKAIEVHTNPGWWSYFLTGAAREDRVPMVAFWTKEPLDEALQSVKAGSEFPTWNFNLK